MQRETDEGARDRDKTVREKENRKRNQKEKGLKDSERKGKETKTGERTYNLRQRLTETGSKRAVLHQAPLSG